MSKHYPCKCVECGAAGRCVQDDDGYTVVCTNKNCTGAPALAITEATVTKEAAWDYWNYKNGATYARN